MVNAMRVVVKVVSGPGVGRQKLLLTGQSLVVGRTSQADWDFPSNTEMSSVHFQVRSNDHGCQVKDLKSRNGTFLDDQRLEGESLWRLGGTLRAGLNTFAIAAAEGAAGESSASPDASGEQREPASAAGEQAAAGAFSSRPPPVPGKANEVLGVDGLSPEAVAMLVAELSPLQFAQSLLDRGLLADAARFLAHAFDRRAATQWAWQCVQAQLPDPSPDDSAILELVQRWLSDPSDALRREVYAAGENVGFGTAASWVALSAFWSEGSMGPPAAPPVPAAPHLTAHAVCGALQLVAVAVPEQAEARLRENLHVGLQRLADLTHLAD